MTINKKLMKEILIATRDKNADDTWVTFNFSGYYDENSINNHVRIADDMGLIEMIDLSSIGNRDYKPKWLTAYGHDYLNNQLAPWWKKFLCKIWDVTGKLVWITIGAAIGSASTMLVQKYLTEFLN